MAEEAVQTQEDTEKSQVTFADPFGSETPDTDEEGSAADSSLEKPKEGYVSNDHKIVESSRIEELSTKFATAYEVKSSIADGAGFYALVLENNFPINIPALEALKDIDSDNVTRAIDYGKVNIGKSERFGVILTRPPGKPIRKAIEQGLRFNEKKLADEIVRPINDVLYEFHGSGFCFGNINSDTVYYDVASGLATVTTSLGEFSGYSQDPAYENVNRLICTNVAKAARDVSADFYSLGMLSLTLITGELPYEGMSEDEITRDKLENGTLNGYVSQYLGNSSTVMNLHTQQLMRGLLNDEDSDRWGEQDVADWCRKKDKSSIPPSRVHKETGIAFIFDGKEYLSRKYLAYDIQKNWEKAKSLIKVEDVSRWIKLALKMPKLSDIMDGIDTSIVETNLSDEKLSRLLHLLDSTGPIRYKDYAISIWGVGSFIANAFIEKDRDALHVVGNMFGKGLVENWINIQESPDEYSFSALLWTPFKINQLMQKGSFGFGMERCLYTLNPGLACQSTIVAGHYAANLRELLITLDDIAKSQQSKTDPIDRHCAAFIGKQIDLTDEIRVKSVQRHPSLSRNPRISMVALLAVAQGESRIRSLKNLTNWMKERVSTIADEFHNKRISKDFRTSLEKAAKSGSLNDLFKVVSNPSFARRDQSGFVEAKRQYKMLSGKIQQLGQQSSLEKMAYQYGLRISVMFAYFVLVATLLLVLFRTT